MVVAIGPVAAGVAPAGNGPAPVSLGGGGSGTIGLLACGVTGPIILSEARIPFSPTFKLQASRSYRCVDETLFQRVIGVFGGEFFLQFGAGSRTNRLNRRSDDIAGLLQKEVRLDVAADPQRDRCRSGQGTSYRRLCEDGCEPRQHRGQEISCQAGITDRPRELQLIIGTQIVAPYEPPIQYLIP